MKKIWAVSAGSYSDYHVMALFKRKADAERFAELYGRFSISKWKDKRGSLSDQLDVGVVDPEREEDEEKGYYAPYDGDVRVEEMLVYDSDELPRPVVLYYVEVDPNGNEVARWEDADWPWKLDSESEDGVITSAFHVLRNRIRAWSVRGYDAALKAARDRLYELKAKDSGVS